MKAQTKAKKAYKRFDPEGDGYDERLGDELIGLMPLTIPKPNKFVGNVISGDNSFQAWVWHNKERDYFIHGGSLDPRTGMVLKGRKHKTYHLMEEEEHRRGNIIVKQRDGRYYSVPNPDNFLR